MKRSSFEVLYIIVRTLCKGDDDDDDDNTNTTTNNNNYNCRIINIINIIWYTLYITHLRNVVCFSNVIVNNLYKIDNNNNNNTYYYYYFICTLYWKELCVFRLHTVRQLRQDLPNQKNYRL